MTVGANRRRGVRENTRELVGRVFTRSGALPWTGTQLGNRQSRSRMIGRALTPGRQALDSIGEGSPGTAQPPLSRPASGYDATPTHHTGRLDDAGSTIESFGNDRAHVVSRAGVHDRSESMMNRTVLNRTPGEYDDGTYVQSWDSNGWTVGDRAPSNDPTPEGWVRDRG